MLYLCAMMNSSVGKQGRTVPNPIWAGRVKERKISGVCTASLLNHGTI